MKRIIIVLTFFLLSSNTNAQIQIESVFNPGIDRSNGYINVQAVGSAEPFRIELWRGDAKVGETPTTYISGVYSFRDLPAGTYNIKFWDKLNCITQLEQVLIEEYFCDIDITLVAFKHSSHFYTEECVIPNSDEGYTAGETEDGVLEIIVHSNESTRVEWKGPGGFTSDALRIENLEAGFYEVTVYDIGDASCKSKVEYSVYFCEERHGGCDGDLISFYEGYHNGTNQESPLDFNLVLPPTAPSGMACNGSL